MKKTFAILLALIMVLSLATAASAASITITPPTVPEGATETGITYTAYKIFDATITYKTDGTIEKVSYTIHKDSIYYNTVDTSGYFTLTEVAGSAGTYVVTANDNYDSDAAKLLAAELQKVAANGTNLTKQDDGSYKASDLADGYYLVTSSVGSALVLDTIGDISIETKNEYPTLEKKVEGAESTTADMGEVLDFTIDVKIPANAVGEIVVHDTMTGLEYQTWNAVDGITVATAGLSDDCAVHFTLTADYVAANKGKTITIEYTAKVTADVANNEAWLVDSTYTSNPDDTDVYSTDIVINKVDGSNKTTPLAGAKFVLKNADGKFYSVDANGDVSWVSAQTSATEVTTGADGKAEFANIADGTYYLIETEAPAGYNLLKDPVEVVVAAVTETVEIDGVPTEQVKDVEKTIENNSGTELPSTGGVGTTLFYVFGSMMVVGAAIVLITKKRMGAAE